MKLSAKRREAIYMAIHESVMNLRIALTRDGLPAKQDAQIAQVETDIWQRVRRALNAEES